MQDYYKFKFPKGKPVAELRMEGWASYVGGVGIALVVTVPATTENTNWQNQEAAFLIGTIGVLVLLAHVAEELPRVAKALIVLCLLGFLTISIMAITSGVGLLFWGLLFGYYAVALGLLYRPKKQTETE